MDFVGVDGVFTWDPAVDALGNYKFVLDATYGSYKDHREFSVELRAANSAPILEDIIVPLVAEGALLTIALDALDPEGDEITYSFTCPSAPLAACSPGMDISVLGVFTWTPGYADEGSHNVVYAVTDANGGSDTKSATIVVTNTNRAPALEDIVVPLAAEGSALTITLNGSDPDDDALAYSFTCPDAPLATCPAGMSVSAVGVFTWTPGYADAGDHNVVFKITDDGLPTAESTSKTATIIVDNTNRAPMLNDVGAKSVKAIEALEITLSADNPDSDTITYSFLCESGPCPAGMSMLDGVFSWTPLCSEVESYDVSFSVEGDLTPLEKSSEIVTITVNDNQKCHPMILTFKTTGPNQWIRLPVKGAGVGYDYTVNWGDSADVFSFSHPVEPAMMRHQYAAIGTYTVTITGQFPAMESPWHGEYTQRLVGVADLGQTGLTDLQLAFAGCTKLADFNVGSGDLSKVTTMQEMFYQTKGLVTLNLSGIDTSEVTTMVEMFAEATDLVSVDLSNLVNSKLKTTSNMFYGTTALTSINFTNFKTDAVTSMGAMFYLASGLTSLDLSSFNTENVTNMGAMFQETVNLTSLDLSTFNTSAVTNYNSLFSGASFLDTLDLNGWTIKAGATVGSAFSNTGSLTNVYCDQATVGTKFSLSGVRECKVGP